MNHTTYESKKNFIGQTLSRCVAAMFPRVVRLEYHLHDNDDEVAIIRFVGGYTRRVCVTGQDLRQTTETILAELAPEVA